MQEPPDYADQLLIAEHSHLLSLKRSLEAQLHKVQFQLHELNTARSRLAAVIQERSRVTELLCQAVSFDQGVQSTPRRHGSGVSLRRLPQPLPLPFLPEREGLKDDGRPLTRSSVLDSRLSTRPLTRSSIMESRPLTRGSVMERPLTRSGMGNHQKAYSAPVPLELGILDEGGEAELTNGALELDSSTPAAG